MFRAIFRVIRRVPANACYFLGICIILSACSVVQSVQRIETVNGRCDSELGSYSLPKTNLRVTVTQNVDLGNPHITYPYVLETIEPLPRADRKHTYCLDYLASSASDDQIRVRRSKGDASGTDKIEGKLKNTPFLQLIASHSVDMTGIVVRKLIRTLFIGLSQNPNFTPAARALGENQHKATVAELEFDPFDPLEMAKINDRLKQFGFCLVLEAYSYDTHRASGSTYCSNPTRTVQTHPSPAAEIVSKQRRLGSQEITGVYYRPKATYSLAVLTKDDPDGPETWRLAKLQSVKLENISPVVALGIERAVFAARSSALIFDDGHLRQICIAKGSEIEGAIQIPLDVIYGLVALPSQIIQIQIDNANQHKEVIEAENRVIQAQQQLIAYELNPQGTPPPAATAKPTFDPLTLNDLTPQVSGIIEPTVAIATDDFETLSNICKNLEKVDFQFAGPGQ